MIRPSSRAHTYMQSSTTAHTLTFETLERDDEWFESFKVSSETIFQLLIATSFALVLDRFTTNLLNNFLIRFTNAMHVHTTTSVRASSEG